MLVIRNTLDIYRARAEMVVAFLGLQSFCWIHYLWFLYLWFYPM